MNLPRDRLLLPGWWRFWELSPQWSPTARQRIGIPEPRTAVGTRRLTLVSSQAAAPSYGTQRNPLDRSANGRKAHNVATGDNPLTVDEFCTIYKVSRSTFYDWRAKGRAPKCRKLPNGEIRIRSSDADRWFDGCSEGL